MQNGFTIIFPMGQRLSRIKGLYYSTFNQRFLKLMAIEYYEMKLSISNEGTGLETGALILVAAVLPKQKTGCERLHIPDLADS